MKKMRMAAAFIPAFALASVVNAQPKSTTVVASEVEAVVKVISVDRKARTATVRGAGGGVMTIVVPPEAQNFDQVKPESLFKVRYMESVAVSLNKGGKASASESQTVQLAQKGGTPGGMTVDTKQITATVEAIDYKNRLIAVKGARKNILAVKVADDVESFEQITVGDSITLSYTEALAMQMVAQPKAKSSLAPAR
jgi:hypothetical protein